MNYIGDILISYNVNKDLAGYLSYVILVTIIILTCVIVNLITKKVILKLFTRVILKNKYQWDDILLKHKVFIKLSNIIPGIIVYLFAQAFNNVLVIVLVVRIATIYLLIMTLFVVKSLLDAINDIYRTYPISKVRPIKGLLQVVEIIFYIIIGIVIIGTLMNQNPMLMLGGIGAVAAVFSFVFKDSILGFIAGIQLTSNDMLRIGDWIEMTKYGADGDVIDITLNTVKVQNFDKTIVSLPAYALVSDSFKNWRGMTEFGGRRMKRSIYIDVNSINFCTPEMIEKFKKINYLKDYITEKEQELSNYNKQKNADNELRINGRYMTNVGTFRIYIQFYLKNNPRLLKEMPQMVRQLPPTENGLPLEIYAFADVTEWQIYETIQADIFDHIFSIAEEFGLRLFQNPTGYDMRQISVGDPTKTMTMIVPSED
ncbi:MAG: mechanosensitive ion channel family protein [Herbinix sp.]|nr:mechanosensitive ion channel family protein [Herbinix sp.]